MLLALFAQGAVFAESESADTLTSLLSETCDVQESHLEYLDTIALTSQAG